jgi:soluble lytic murein transglycosylase-like protein
MFEGGTGILQATTPQNNAPMKGQSRMRASYRISVLAMMFIAGSAFAGGSRFSASDVPSGLGIKHQGKIVIRNDARSMTAYRFFGNVSEALVSIRISRTLQYSTYGKAVYDSSAQVNTPFADVIAEASRAHGVDPRLVAAVAHRESRFNPKAVSPVGAVGLMQLMPATARYLGVKDIFDARQNVFGGVRYLRTLLDTFHGDLDLTLAAYNAGPGAVQKYNGVPPYRETRNYVSSIRAAYERALQN